MYSQISCRGCLCHRQGGGGLDGDNAKGLKDFFSRGKTFTELKSVFYRHPFRAGSSMMGGGQSLEAMAGVQEEMVSK